MLRLLLAVVLTVLTLLSSPLVAQEVRSGDYTGWERLATQAEALQTDSDITDDQLAAMRAQVVEWRRQFNEDQNINSGRIGGLREQIAALGAPPEDGTTEAADIAARRTELQEQLTTLSAPGVAAVEAFQRAEAIVRHIDDLTRERQATVLARLSPSPLLPENWALATTQTASLVTAISAEFAERMNERGNWEHLKPRLPRVLAYLVSALLLLTVGRYWVVSLPSRLSARALEYSRAVVAFVVSLAQIAIPMAGIYLAVSALQATGFFGPITLPLLQSLPTAAVILFGGNWLARLLFPLRPIAYQALNMPDEARSTARRLVETLAALFAIHHILSSALLPLSGLYELGRDSSPRAPFEFDEGAVAVWHFVLIALTALFLFRLGNILRRLGSGDRGGSNGFRHRVLSIVGYLTRAVVVLSVLLTAIGLVNIGNVLMWPWLSTLALIGLLILLQDFIADLFNMLKRGEEGAREGLAPLLTGFALILLSVPLFMVIWGASRTDLVEYWDRIQRGVQVGGVSLSPGSVLTFLLVLAVGVVVTRAVQGAFRSSILPKTRLDSGGQNAVVSGLGYLGFAVAGLMAVTSAGIDLSSFAIVAGALSVGIGFGLQNVVSNFVSGIILLIERPISVGDWISAGGQQGIVRRISVRSTQVETFDRTEVIVPNSDLVTQPVINWTRHNQLGRIVIPVGVSYGSDTRRIAGILQEIIEDQPTVTIDPAPVVLFRGISVDSMNFEIRAVLSDISAGAGVTSEIFHQIVERFAREDIGMPFTTRDRWPPLPPAPEPVAPPVAPVSER